MYIYIAYIYIKRNYISSHSSLPNMFDNDNKLIMSD